MSGSIIFVQPFLRADIDVPAHLCDRIDADPGFSDRGYCRGVIDVNAVVSSEPHETHAVLEDAFDIVGREAVFLLKSIGRVKCVGEASQRTKSQQNYDGCSSHYFSFLQFYA